VDISLKQRLIGAAVIVAIAVIFIPMLFDNAEHKEPVTLDMSVPPKPRYTFEQPQRHQASPANAQAFNAGAGVERPGATGTATRSKLERQLSARQMHLASDASKPLSARAQKGVKNRGRGAASTQTESQAVWPTEQTHPAPSVNAGKAKVATAPTRIAPPDLKGPMSEDSQSLPEIAVPKATNALPAGVQTGSPSAKSSSSADALLSGWAVQVGSFSERGNAMLLVNRLRSSGFTAFQERGASAGEPIFRVKVGPEQNRARAEALQARLRNQENLQGIVVSQSPDS
jgi:DedD protein